MIPVATHGRQELRSGNLFDDRTADSGHERVAVKRSALIARFEQAKLFTSQKRSQGDATADSFSESHHVRPNLRMLETEHPSSTADAGLDLIEHEEHTSIFCKLSQVAHKFAREGNHTRFALDRFEQDCRS